MKPRFRVRCSAREAKTWVNTQTQSRRPLDLYVMLDIVCGFVGTICKKIDFSFAGIRMGSSETQFRVHTHTKEVQQQKHSKLNGNLTTAMLTPRLSQLPIYNWLTDIRTYELFNGLNCPLVQCRARQKDILSQCLIEESLVSIHDVPPFLPRRHNQRRL